MPPPMPGRSCIFMLFICLLFSFGCATPPSQSQKQAYFGSVADNDPLEPLNRPVTGLFRASHAGRTELTDAVTRSLHRQSRCNAISNGNRTGPVVSSAPDDFPGQTGSMGSTEVSGNP